MDRHWEEETGSKWAAGTWGHQPPSALFHQLPSNATLRFRGDKALAWGAVLGEWAPQGIPQAWGSEGSKEEVAADMETIALQQLPLCMAEKRRHRLQAQKQAGQHTRWQQWQAGQQRLRRKVGSILLHTQLWRSSLTCIEGHFGTGIEAYFNFLRFLVLLNLVGALLIGGFVVAPSITFEALRLNQTERANLTANSPCMGYDPNPRGLVSYFTYVMDLLSGTGFMELTYLFYGYYQNSVVDVVGFSYNISLAYLLAVLCYFLLCLAWIVHRSVHLLKRGLVSEDGALSTYSIKVFAGWDFGLTQPPAAIWKHNSIRYELKLDLEEEASRRAMAQRSPAQRAWLYTLRSLINLLVVALLGVAFYCIYLATEYSQSTLSQQSVAQSKSKAFWELLVSYLPSIVITGANLVVPMAFGVLVRLEQYPFSQEIKLTLVRSVFLRLASLVVLLVSLWMQITCHGQTEAFDCRTCGYNHRHFPCWETRVGQEMYKLLVFDLLTMLLVTLLVEFPRKILVSHGPALLARLWGQQEFLVPANVLDLVYGQTVCWVGASFCPLLPLLNTLKYILLFYLKKLTLFSNCRPGDRTFRASSSNFFFLLVLLLGLAISWVPALYSIFALPPSQACGPFRAEPSMWNAALLAIDGLPELARGFFYFVGSLGFIVPLLLLLCIFLFYLMALADSYSRLVKELKMQLQLEGRDKVFLVNQITELS
ncbi:transmembrane channel-like protein 4 isoform X1 [Alligator sinensis]|uniref:Transmembrane channel-like protein n=1 Tax=Alligator sinensis TaxID=38654 RepID=A0A1U8CV73_ALLSI|nr:transmembrane channel-like protein 4 isoform X1 [Alligator sinensis]